MARVREIPSAELPQDAAAIYERFAREYGPFRNQVAVFAHVPAAVRHLMAMLMELREAKTLPKRYLELAIVAGRRLPLESASLDLIAGPALAMASMPAVTTPAPAGSSAGATSAGATSSGGLAPRVLLGARLNSSARFLMRTFIGVEGEWAPAGARVAGPGPDPRHLPVWTAGIALGATLGTRR